MPRQVMYDTIKEQRRSMKKYSGLPRKKQRCSQYRGRSGRVKVFTEEEKYLYMLKHCPKVKWEV